MKYTVIEVQPHTTSWGQKIVHHFYGTTVDVSPSYSFGGCKTREQAEAGICKWIAEQGEQPEYVEPPAKP